MRTRLLLTAAFSAQVISPVQAATGDGNSSSASFMSGSSPFRYMQIHSDLIGTPRQIKTLSFRLEPGASQNLTAVRQLDLALQIGLGGGFDTAQLEFDKNYGKFLPTIGIARKVVNFGPQGTRTAMGAQPFLNMNLVLDTLFPYNGTGSLVWDVQLFGSVQVNGIFFSAVLDAEASSTTKGTTTLTGPGCLATGLGELMTQTITCVGAAGTLMFGLDVRGAPSNAACALALGATNPSLTVTGLCSKVLTDLAIVLPIGTSGPTGFLQDAAALVAPNTTPGAAIFTQVHGLDPGRSDPLKVCNSTGSRTVFPAPDTSHRVRVSALRSRLNEFQRTQVDLDEMVGFGLVVRFVGS